MYWDMPSPNPQLGAKRMCYFSAKLWVRVRPVPIPLQLMSNKRPRIYLVLKGCNYCTKVSPAIAARP